MATAKVRRNLVLEKAHLHNFVFWVRNLRPRGLALVESDKTLESVALLVEKVLAGKKNPLPKELGRKRDRDTMWLCFHMVAFPIGSRLPLTEEGFDEVASQLSMNLSGKGVESNYYKARQKLKTSEGRREYAAWLNHREKRWATYKKKQSREYALSSVMNQNEGDFYGHTCVTICTRREETGEEHIVSLSPEERNSVVRQAEDLCKTTAGRADRTNWLGNQNQILQITIPSNPKGKRRNHLDKSIPL
jgi:hypothetical protein